MAVLGHVALALTISLSGPVLAQTAPIFAYAVPTNGGYSHNGNLTNYSDSVTGTWTLQYDQLNRLHTATATSGYYQGLTMAWEYDSFGNRLSQTPSGSASANVPVAVPATYGPNNQLWTNNVAPTRVVDSNGNVTAGIVHDPAGDMIFDGTNHLLYDAENRVCAISNSMTGVITQYLYNAEGQRVAKGHPAGSSNALVCPTGAGDFVPTATYIVGQSGEQVTELNGSGNWVHSNVYAAGELLATYDEEVTTDKRSIQQLHFNVSDPLGTKRVQTTAAGVSELTCVSVPFGDGQACSGPGQDATEHHFTGKERDAESGLDYFGARYYGSNMGRWMSPDPSNWGVDFYYPQTWNHYAYVGNNPLSNTDPNGLWLTPTHNSIINNSFPGLSKEQRQILQASSKEVDTHQGQEDQYMHGMDSVHNNPEEGAYNPEIAPYDFIQQNEHDAKQIQADWIASGHTGIAPAALAAFGNALHTITDEYSPSHTGFQNVHGLKWVSHMREGFAMVGMYGNSTRSAQAAARTAFYDVFGSDLGQQATHEKVTVKIIFDPNQKLPDQQQ